jgi:UBX domain
MKLSGDQKSPPVSVQADYGPVTAEPPIGDGREIAFITSIPHTFKPIISNFCPSSCPFEGDDPSVVRVSVKLPWGKQIVRRFRKNDSVQNIFAFANSLVVEKEGVYKSFDLCTAYPSMSLKDHLDETIEVAGVSGSQVILRFDA